MPLTKDFTETIKARAKADSGFRVALLREALEAIVNGELEVAKILLRDYVNATCGFTELGDSIGKSPKSLMRMLSESGNPNAANLFSVTRDLLRRSGTSFTVVQGQDHKPAKGKRVANR